MFKAKIKKTNITECEMLVYQLCRGNHAGLTVVV